MKIGFSNQVVIVTGATRGIGLQITEDLALLGAQLILTGTDNQQIQKLNLLAKKKKQKRIYYCVDMSDRDSLGLFLKEIGRLKKIDVVVNNAGINRINLLEETKEEDWDDMLAVNLKGPYLLTRAVAKIMKKNRYGRIINIASIFGTVSKPKRSIYTTTKAGIIGFTKAASNELAAYNILVNAVSPGFILTDLTRKNLSEQERKGIAKIVPAQRLGTPKDVSNVVMFLASGLNTYLTGKDITVDGGYTDV